MRRRRCEGETLREIAAALGKAKATVYEHVKDISWPPSGGHNSEG
jgi:DNA-binding NarL/FixJ family response regulator